MDLPSQVLSACLQDKVESWLAFPSEFDSAVRKCYLTTMIANLLRQKTHQFEDLNDNRDGTFSIVGSHKQNRACVVSRNRPGPDEPPALDPCFPLTTAESRVAERQREDLRVPTRTPSLGTASSTALTRNENIVNASGSADLWNYLCSQIGAQIPSPEIPALKLLLGLPRVRDLDTTRPLSAGLSADLNDKQIAGLIIQVTGEDAPSRCTECRRHNGPFRSCIRPSREVAQDISGFLRSSLRACGNCFVRKNSHACSVKSMAATGLKSAARNQSRDGDTPMADAPLSLHESMLGRRRSSRLFLANTEHEGDAEDEESGNEAPAPDSRPSRRLVTMKVTRPVQQAQPPSQKRAAVKETTAPPEADLHMEDWEMADGRVNSTTSDNGSFPPPPFTTPHNLKHSTNPADFSTSFLLHLPNHQPDRPHRPLHHLPGRDHPVGPRPPVPRRRVQDARVHARRRRRRRRRREARRAGRGRGRRRRRGGLCHWRRGRLQDCAWCGVQRDEPVLCRCCAACYFGECLRRGVKRWVERVL